MKNKFLQKVSEQIVDEKSRNIITAELESHLLDKIDYYTDIGYSKEEAEKRATDEMGNPDDTAVPLNALHNNKYRNLPTFICCGIIIILFICTLNLREWYIYSYDSMLYRHDTVCDFVSISFLITYAVLLIFAQKKNNKIIPLFVAISFVLQFASMLFHDDFDFSQQNMLYFYQPAMYALVKIITEGFVAYSQCIFIEAPAQTNYLTTFCFEVMPYILGVIFIVWSVILLIKILRMERITDYKGLKIPVCIIKICMCVFLALNFAVMTVTAVSTAVTDLITGNSYSKSSHEMLKYVLNADLTKEDSAIFSDLESQGYYKYSETPNEDVVYYDRDKAVYLSSDIDVTGDSVTISYSGIPFIPFAQRQGEFSDGYGTYDETPETLADVDKIKGIKVGTSFEDIEKSGLLKYATSVEKTYYKDSQKTGYIITLLIDFKSNDYTRENSNSCYKNLIIEDGKVIDYLD